MVGSGKRALLVGLTFAACLLTLPASAAANAGELDPSFGVAGIARAGVHSGFPQDLAIDRRGGIVVAGYRISPGGAFPVVTRMGPEGTLDEGFGSGPWCAFHGSVFGLAVDGAGRIVLAGTTGQISSGTPDVCVVRLLGSGGPDPSFSDDGMLKLDTGGPATDVAVDGEGRILLASGDGLTAIRLTDRGVLDPTFGEGGIASLQPGQASEAQTIAADPSGRVLLAGKATIAGNPLSSMAVVRLDADGQPDPSFAGTGYETLGPGSTGGEVATDLVLDQFGRLLLSGRDGALALVARLLPSGAPDPSFGAGGRVLLPVPGVAVANGIAVDRSGRILTTGGIRMAGPYGDSWEAFLSRIGPAGAIDSSFGAEGLVRENEMTGYGEGGAAVAVDSAGRYLVTAMSSIGASPTADPSSMGDVGVARFLPEAQVVPTPTYRCRGRKATIAGTPGRDVLRGTRRRDVIVSFGGNDRIRAFAGRDLVCAGSGRDSLRGGSGNDLLFGGRGNDRLFGQGGRDRLRGGPGSDHLVGGPGRDSQR
jgi:uncharacterized delta-60 repeat protein